MRKPHLLKPDLGGGAYNRIVYFDSESRLREESDVFGERIVHLPYLVCASFNDYKYGRHWTADYYGEGFLDRFWNDVMKFSKKGRTLLIAHNANYDVLVTGGIPRLTKGGFRATSFFSQGTVFILDMAQGKRTISIISSTNIYSTSLANLARTFDMEKMEVDYNESSLDEVIPYCRNDVAILQTAMEAFFDFVRTEELGSLARTIAGQAFCAYRHRFMTEEIYIHSEPDALALEREAYCGGRVELFHRGRVPGKVTYLDVNSMYPFVMKANLYPTKLVTRKKHITVDELQRFTERYLVIARVTVSPNEPVFPMKLAGALVFPVGTFQTVLSTPELLYACNHGYIQDVHEANLYDAGDLFSSYVDYFYQKRLDAKRSGDKVRNELYKLFLNSLYGKFGQRGDKWVKVRETEPDEIYQETVYDAETRTLQSVKAFGGTVFRKVDETESYNSFPAVAAHVTAYARMSLWAYMKMAGLENVVYADTDSLFVTDEGKRRLESQMDEILLGALKVEDESENVILNAPKDYQFGETVKHKGIPKNAEVTDKGYKVVLWGKLSGYLRNKTLDGYQNEIRYKTDSGRYLKAWIDLSGRAVPFRIVDGEITEPEFPLQEEGQLQYVFKRYRMVTRAEAEEVLMKEERTAYRDYLKSLRKAILSLGGINDKDYKHVPIYLRRKAGYGLDEIRTELQSLGFVFSSTDELYETIQGRVQ